MKMHKMFCIDEEVVDFLKEKNASKLVNRLLLEHIDKDSLEGMNKPQLQAELDVNKLTRETDKRIKELRKNAK